MCDQINIFHKKRLKIMLRRGPGRFPEWRPPQFLMKFIAGKKLFFA